MGDLDDVPTRAFRPGDAPRELDRLGSYTLLERLGQGGYGAVYRARHPLLGEVALKVLHASASAELRSFVREGTIVLEHPGIPRVLDHGQIEGTWFLAQELVAGRSLASLLAEGPLP